MFTRKPQSRAKRNEGAQVAGRSLWLGIGFALWMVGVVARLYSLQIIQYGELLNRALRQQQRTVEITPKRGTIFDRESHPLAMSLAVDSIQAVPAEIPKPEMVAGLVAPTLRLDTADLLGRLRALRSFCWVKRKVSAQDATRVRELNLKGVYFQKE